MTRTAVFSPRAPECGAHARQVLASLLEDTDTRNDIVREDGFRVVLGLATSNDEYIQTIAAFAVENLPVQVSTRILGQNHAGCG